MTRKIQTALLLVIAGFVGLIAGAVIEVPLVTVLGILCLALALIALVAGAVQGRVSPADE